jgi:SOS-response transcriptional repressor LexA
MPHTDKPNQELTTREREVLKAYRDHLEAHGYPPTNAQLARQFELSWNSIKWAIDHLMKKGYLQEKKVTAIRLTLSQKGRKVEL